MKTSGSKWEQVRTWLLWIALPLLIGILIALAIPQPEVGLIRLEDAIYPYSAHAMVAQINYAIDRPEIRSVVIEFDSPGGTVVDTEAVYMELARLRAKKPVVIVINGMAASGAYYLSANSDYIYAKPSSLVGNVGVYGYLPPTPFIYEDLISTGPYKLWGEPRDTEMRQIEMLKQGFYQAVTLGRGSRLKIGPDILLRGEIWPGTDALRLGLIDALGTETDAFNKAADLARVWHFKTVDLSYLIAAQISNGTFFAQGPDGATLPYPKESGLYMLYIPQLPAEK